MEPWRSLAGRLSGGDSNGEQGRRRRLLVLLLGLAAALRVSYLFAYLDLPFSEGPLVDSLVYLAQARAIARGDFGNASLLAFSPLYG